MKGAASGFGMAQQISQEPVIELTQRRGMDISSTGGVDAEIERTLMFAMRKRTNGKRHNDMFKQDLRYLRARRPNGAANE